MSKISIITASYNYEDYIKETIESVISQTFQDWEMVIVDDGSKDNSVEVIKSYAEKDSRIKLYQHEGGINKGLVETVKLGIEKAQGDWIVFLESDDSITPNYLEEKLNVLKQYPEVKFIFNDVNMFGDETVIHRFDTYFEEAKEILKSQGSPANLLKYFAKINLVPTFSVVMVHKSLLMNLDYNVAHKPLLDVYIWAQIAQKSDFYYIDKKLTNWRMHKDSYLSAEYPEKNKLKFKLQINSVVYYNNLFKRIFENFIAYRKYCIKVKKDKIYFMGKWYYWGAINNE